MKYQIPVYTIGKIIKKDGLYQGYRPPLLGVPTYDSGGAYDYKEKVEWRGVLTFKHFSRGCSSARAIFSANDIENSEAEMFLTDLADIIPFINKGEISGTFEVCKRGANFAWRLKQCK